jgi:hypothetical protein
MKHNDLSQRLFGRPRVHTWHQESQRQTLANVLQQHHTALSTFLPRPLEIEDVLDLAGIPNTYQVRVLSTWTHGFRANITGQGTINHRVHTLERQILTFEDDALIINSHQVNHSPRLGHGACIFAHQVSKAQQLGFSRLELKAARGPAMNGYYTWPRFGCDGSLGALRNPIQAEFEARTQRAFPDWVQTVLDLFQLPEGVAIWMDSGQTIDLQFNLESGSRSWSTLQSYLDEKGIILADGWL